MLNRKNLLMIAAVLVILVVVSIYQSTRHDEATSRSSSELLVDGEIARGNLERLVLGHGDDDNAVVLERGPEHWLAASAFDAKVDNARLDALLTSLSNLRGEFRSDNESVLSDYGFADTSTVRLHAYDESGTEVVTLDLGGKPTSGQGSFVKRPGSNAVYLSTVNLLGNLGLWSGPDRPATRHFLDLQAYSGDKNNVESISVVSEQTLVLTKEYEMIQPAEGDTINTTPYPDTSSWEWRLNDGKLAVKTKADGVLNSAINMRAQDVADPSAGLAAYGLEPPARTATLTMADGSIVTMQFGSEREAEGTTPGGYYAQIGSDPTIWVLSKYSVDNLFKAEADLLPSD